MDIVIGFSPWILFWSLASHFPLPVTAGASAALALLTNARTLLRGRKLKTLEVGSLITLCIMTAAALLIREESFWRWSYTMGNLAMLLVILFSVIIKRPFVIEYAWEEIPPERRSSQGLYRACRMVSLVWIVVLSAMTLGSTVRIFWKDPVLWLLWLTHMIIFSATMGFTRWYKYRALKAAK